MEFKEKNFWNRVYSNLIEKRNLKLMEIRIHREKNSATKVVAYSENKRRKFNTFY